MDKRGKSLGRCGPPALPQDRRLSQKARRFLIKT
jgi:hypothetical protein